METRRGNVMNNEVTDGFMYCDLTECYIHTLANPVYQINGCECVLGTRYNNDKKMLTTYQGGYGG